MKKALFSGLLVLSMVLSLMPITALAAEGDICLGCGAVEDEHGDTAHKANCRFTCPIAGCTVTYGSSGYQHSDKQCPYSDSALYCPECGYLTYVAEEDDYYHAAGCSIGYPDDGGASGIGDDVPLPSDFDLKGDDDVIYFGVDSDHFDDSTKMFEQDMLISQNSDYLSGKSTASLWQYLAYAIQDQYGMGTGAGKFKTQFDNVISKGLAYNTNSAASYSGNHTNGDNTYKTAASGIIYDKSMSDAGAAIETAIFSAYRANGGGRNDKYGSDTNAAVKKNSALSEDTDAGDVFWMLTGAYKTSGTNKKGHYQALAVLFSDFKITAILPEDDGKFYQSKISESAPGSKTYASDVNNMTAVP
ncbi:MAG: hypothetical protein PHT34_05390, partial [Oscillospiraceae bacterium]|nr:hypothetical protein [Oscillospiraceae bacterium]